ncbi:TonB-dependent receptor domain-containing protein [Phenylobacterium sp.]|jgi:outer membrane receptor protein involved in Fe transport|uniref:TonB-dependent receptor domain-containing protein n=1 Tax=Phenylobacterium sp. TaxID=1871053 RepID=UPI002F94DB20
MKVALSGASRAAILIALASMAWAGSASAQTPPPGGPPASGRGTPDSRAGADNSSQVEEVVVTGSLIRGTPEDAALPVEVYTQEELEKQGAPTALEFAKTLTISGPVTGEAYYFSGAALTGSVQYNLRGIGADKTLTLLNGRRGSENTSNIPGMALARTEVLKDGAAVTYGADAVGGVVNFITRERFVGLEAQGQYKYIDGSDGDYSLGIMAGVGEGDVNFLVSAEYEHRSRLSTLERDITNASFTPTSVPGGYNSAPWSTLTNLAGWTPRGALPATPSVANEFGTALGAPISDFTPASCAAVGGRFDNSFTCAYNYIPYYNLVEENDIYRVYAQLNAKITDNMNFHAEASYGQVVSPQVFGSPAQPVIRGPAMATGATNQFYVPITNPHAAAFRARTGAPATTQGFTPTTYRAFAHGGNPFLGEGNGFGVPSKIDNQIFRISASLRGTLGDWAGPASDIGYDAAVTYNQANLYSDAADIIGFRLQEALNGFGGPACNAPDLDPNRFGTQNPALAGKGNCMWWNPFSTNFPNQPARGLANPNFVAGTENSEELSRWLFDPRADETITQSITADLVFNGGSGITLPGGEVAWALGMQARAIESRENIESPLYNGNTPCDWPAGTTSTNGAGTPPLESNPFPTNDPRFRGCTPDSPGPFVFFGINPPNNEDQQQFSYFGELQVPVLENLNFQLAVRREQFSDDLSATVYKVAGKWNVWGPLALRGSYGTNYAAPPLGTVPGEVNNAVRSYTIASGNWLGAQFVTDSSLKPETATAWNVGAIWQSDGFADGHSLTVILDYFNIETQDEITQIADPNQIANLVFNGPPGPGGAPNTGTITTCNPAVQPLLNRVTFNNGCTVGMNSVGAFSQIQTLVGNGPGQTTNGFDLQATYSMPFWQGDLTLGATATYVTELRTGPTSLDGVVVSTGDDRLGTLNFATVASAAPKLRANFSANYAMERQNLRLGVQYVSAVTDERPGIQYGENGEEWVIVDVTYRIELMEDLALTASIGNLFDRAPPPAQEELGYDPRLGNPLGRTFEIGIRKTF